jgi:hypothetical protein
MLGLDLKHCLTHSGTFIFSHFNNFSLRQKFELYSISQVSLYVRLISITILLHTLQISMTSLLIFFFLPESVGYAQDHFYSDVSLRGQNQNKL